MQRTPELFSYLQQIVDENPTKALFCLTGSNNFLLQETISQSLAGRVGYLELLPFGFNELQSIPQLSYESTNDFLFNGGYPAICYENANPHLWFPSYIRTYIERDVRQLKNIKDLALFQKFVYLCAGRIGQPINYSQLGNEVGVEHQTIAAWISVLQASYVIYLLQPYYQNFNKRLVKSPKLYFYDTGLASYLLGIAKSHELTINPFRGALFENMIVNELLKNRFNKAQRSNLFYFRDNTGNEIDVVIDEGNTLKAIEIKSGATVAGSYFKNLHYWKKLTKQTDGRVLYDGHYTSIQQQDFWIQNWNIVNTL